MSLPRFPLVAPTALVALVAFAVLGIAACGADEEPEPFGLTTEGLVLGTSQNGLRVFRGVPFAAPPTEGAAGRFRESARPRSRSQPLVADTSAPDCPQPSGLYAAAPAPQGQRAQSEDCLSLDIWTPAATASDALPVLVWIHGGGLVRGSTARASFDPSQFARRGVVVVALRYRLGALGFLAHPALEAEGSSGLYGLGDQLRALQWVHANAAAFGGDPNRITLGGHSAGAASLLPLMASPDARALFAAAILQSPVVDPFTPQGRADHYASDASVLEAGVAAARALGAESVYQMRDLPAARWANSGFAPLLRLDGHTFPSSFQDALASGTLGRRRLMIGFTDDESFLFLPGRGLPASEAELAARISAESESAGGAAAPGGGGDIAERYAAFLQREAFEKPALEVAAAAQAAGWTVYAYRFSGLHGGARHAAEVSLLLGPERELQKGTASAKLRGALQEYWASFVSDGEPRADEAAIWAPYDAKSGRHLVLSGKIHSATR